MTETFALKPRYEPMMIVAWPVIAALGFLVVAVENVGVHVWPVPIAIAVCIGVGALVWWVKKRWGPRVLVIDGDAVELRCGREITRTTRRELRAIVGHTKLGGRYQSVRFPAVRLHVGTHAFTVLSSEGGSAARGALLGGPQFVLDNEAFKRFDKRVR